MSLEDPEYCRQPKENKLHCQDCINEKNGTKKREEKQNIEYLTFFKLKKKFNFYEDPRENHFLVIRGLLLKYYLFYYYLSLSCC